MAQADDIVGRALRVAPREVGRLRHQNRRPHSQLDEPIAIVGMSCRLPGGVRSAEELWELVSHGGDGVSLFPRDRGWDLEGLYDPDPGAPGTCYAREGGFILDATEFDAGFFGIGAREALAMDPQQRVLLEGAWEASESAGIDPGSLRGSRTGVFVGVSGSEYGTGAGVAAGVEGYLLTGTTGSVVSGRVAYVFGLEGPAVSVDTACSSSLVALHLACQSLRGGECSLALAGGVTVLSSPFLFVEFARQRGLAADGRCKSFAEAADGVGFSEGMGVLVLERLSDAQRSGRRVLGVVRGSAVNQDGASNGLSAPSGPAQQRVITQALASAGCTAQQVDAVEGHGTGTVLGDPMEAQALVATYGRGRSRPLWLGSVKSNIGHTAAAAGVAGVIKMVMAMRHGVLPRTLHVDRPSSRVDWSGGGISLLTEERPWEAGDGLRRAGVSSFGISGTNAHMILEEAPAREPPVRGAVIEGGPMLGATVEGGPVLGPALLLECGAVPWVISGRSVGGRRGQATRLREAVEAGSIGGGVLDVGFSLAGRAALEFRGVVLGGGREELTAGLGVLAGDGDADAGGAGVFEGVVAPGGGRVGLLFSGQGSQHVGMGRELYRVFPVFRAVFDEVCGELDRLLGCSLAEVVFGEGGTGGEGGNDGVERGLGVLDGTLFAQAGLFAVEVAMCRLLQAWGVRPAVLVGHSIGEVAAAFVAGLFSLGDACRLVTARGRLMAAQPAGGAMVSVEACEEEVAEVLVGLEGLSIAAVNGPRSVVVSGGEDVVESVMENFRERGRRVKRLRVSHAFHSPLMDGMLREFGEVVGGIEFGEPAIPIVSNVSGGLASAGEMASAGYWVSHVREAVRFMDGVRSVRRLGVENFLEVGPGGVLSAMALDCLTAAQSESAPQGGGAREPGGAPDGDGGLGSVVAAPLLREGSSEVEGLLGGLARSWVGGVGVDWGSVFEGSGAVRVDLPSYAFQRERYWLSPGVGGGDLRAVGQRPAGHPLLGAAVAVADGGWLFTGTVSLESHPWLADHRVLGVALLPGTAFVELALYAGQRTGAPTVGELTLHAPLLIPATGGRQLQVAVAEPDGGGAREIGIYSRADTAEQDPGGEEWTLHATGTLTAPGDSPPASTKLERGLGALWPPPGAEALDVEALYDALAEHGLEYGPVFQGLTSAWRHGEELYAEVALPEHRQQHTGRYAIHPALLDAALHGFAARLADGESGAGGSVSLPFAWRDVSLLAEGASTLRVCLSGGGEGGMSLAAVDGEGGSVVRVGSLAAREVSVAGLGVSGGARSDSLFCLDWVPAPAVSPERPPDGGWVLLGDEGGGLEVSLGEVAPGLVAHGDLASLGRAVDEGGVVPGMVFVDVDEFVGAGGVGAGEMGAGDVSGIARGMVLEVVELLRSWVGDRRFGDACLALVSRGDVDVDGAGGAVDVGGLVGGGVWGLVRSAQAEFPGRVVLVDVDGGAVPWGVLGGLVGLGEGQVAVRGGCCLVGRLVGAGGGLEVPGGNGEWRLEAGGDGSFEDFRLVTAAGVAGGELGVGEVRVGVRAAGLNFRDVLIALGMYPGAAQIGSEGAGVVLEVGSDVKGFAVGDRVMGLFEGAFGSVAVADQRLLVGVPEGWSFARAASVPTVFLTAFYALVDLAGVRRGERLLVHAAAGGVGMAAVQLAGYLGAEVWATASPEKWGVLEGLGLDVSRVASSRSLEFGERFMRGTGGEGVDVVLDSLAGEFVDVSLGLLCRGGRFIEMGKTDVRDPDEVARAHPGVAYRAFDLMEAGYERIQGMLREIAGLFERGVLEPLPLRAWDIRRAGEAFRFMSQARHVGKIVLRIPEKIPRIESPTPQERGTVLVTGGTGGLGGLVARHLVAGWGVRSVVLASRGGPSAEGADRLAGELEALGARVRVERCDVSDRAQVEGLLEGLRGELWGVVHAAGVLSDSVLEGLRAEDLAGVWAAKADGAWHLHELTRDLDLGLFVLFSSAAGVLGSPGQAAYSAANAFLDSLAVHRQAQGLPGVSLAWGLWNAPGMGSALNDGDLRRLARSGVDALTPERGLGLFDRALEQGDALLVCAALNARALRARANEGTLPPLLSGLAGAARVRPAANAKGALAARMTGLSGAEREALALGVVLSESAGVLGHGSSAEIDAHRAFKDLGFDSLAAVELRNRLAAATALTLPATLVFDYPTPAALTGYLVDRLGGAQAGAAVSARAVVAVDEPVAIVGMSCRYPGGVASPEGLWELVSGGVDAVSGFPRDRGWDLAGLYHPDPDHYGTSYTREGGFVLDADEFDAAFFGIGPREALAMDPQQRLLLEAAWEALEDSAIDPHSLAGSDTGVFAGSIYHDYAMSGLGPVPESLPEGVAGYLSTGVSGSVLSGRVSYVFGLEGPAVTVDTACSSSLVALHLACQSLRAGECSLALAGGVTVLATPGVFLGFSLQRALASDGRCKAFADAADGVGWGEGVGLLALERLSDARRNGRRVLGVVRGSAINQDGASNGLTAPNGPSQQRVIAQALASAGCTAEQVDVVEGHGTGTTLGDPIEAQALLATYGQERARPLWLGSVKSNIGHTQAAAGVAGVIKMVMAMRHGVLPPTLHVDRPSTQVDWSSGAVSLLTEPQPWEPGDRLRRAGVSSFGISGTNAHVILEEAPVEEPSMGGVWVEGGSVEGVPVKAAAGMARPVEAGVSHGVAGGVLGGGVAPWVLSGRGVGGLRGQALELLEAVGRGVDGVVDVGLSLAGRAVLDCRGVVVGSGREEMLGGLGVLAAGGEGGGVVVGDGVGRAGGGVVFVFPGQGSQWLGMGVGLLDESPAFRELVGECERALSPLVGWSVEAVLRGAEGAPDLGRVDVVQPVLWALMVALGEMWRACGVEPAVVVGHSQGEVAAACVAGGLSLEDGARVIVARSRALVGLSGHGGMASVACGAGAVEGLLRECERNGAVGGVGVAAVNGPESVVVSGGVEAVDGFVEFCEGRGVRARAIEVDYAAHSAGVEEIRGELLEGCRGIEPVSGEVPFVSSVTGGVVDMAGLDGAYWFRNLRERVEFDGAVRGLLEEGLRVFVEVSPHPVLVGGVGEVVEDVLGDAGGVVVGGSLRRGEGGLERFSRSLGEVWVRGVEVDWGRVFEGSGGRRVDLPTYAFQRERYWLAASGGVGDLRGAGLGGVAHPLLGAMVALAGGEGVLFTGRVGLEAQGWLADHRVLGVVLLPGTALLELALYAGERMGCPVIGELTLQAPLVLPEEGGVQLQVALGSPDAEGARSVAIYSRFDDPVQEDEEESQWVCHAIGRVDTAESTTSTASLQGQWPPPTATPIDATGLYEALLEQGLEYGPTFQGLTGAWREGEDIYAEVSLPEGQPDALLSANDYAIHPALLDAALHAGALYSHRSDPPSQEDAVRLPFCWEGVTRGAAGASRPQQLRVKLTRLGTHSITDAPLPPNTSDDPSPLSGGVALQIADHTGAPLASVRALTTRPVEPKQLTANAAIHLSLFHLHWTALSTVPTTTRASTTTPWALLGPCTSGLADSLQALKIDVRRHPDLEGLTSAAGDPAGTPDIIFIDCTTDAAQGAGGEAIANGEAGRVHGETGGMIETAHATTQRVLGMVQAWLADDRFAEARLVLVTSGAVAVNEGEDASGIASAPVWGLMRSAQSEHPGRFVLIDVDGGEASWSALPRALAADEPQVAIRGGELFAARLARVVGSSAGVAVGTAGMAASSAGVAASSAGAAIEHSPASAAPRFAPGGTILITGATQGLGALVARHLVARYGVSNLLLVSRRGPGAPGVRELESELAALGARVRVVACDVADRRQLAGVLADIPEEAPLRGVVHAAGVLEDGVIESLSAEAVERVLAPKVDAAWHLHELTKHLELDAFVLFSSVAATFGAPGQGNYSAANAFLDALAGHRRARGLTASSLAWGQWADAGGMTGHLGERDLARLARQGMAALSSEEGLELFDVASTLGDAVVIPVHLDMAVLRARAGAGVIPPLLRGLVRMPARREDGGAGGSLAARLAAVSGEEREGIILELLRGEVASILGLGSAGAVDAQRTFKDLGFDSLGAVELRNRLNSLTGLRLPATLIFDYPTPAASAGHILEQMGREGAMAAPVDVELDRLEALLSSAALEESDRVRIGGRLQGLLTGLAEQHRTQRSEAAEKLQSASVEEIIDFIDGQLDLT